MLLPVFFLDGNLKEDFKILCSLYNRYSYFEGEKGQKKCVCVCVFFLLLPLVFKPAVSLSGVCRPLKTIHIFYLHTRKALNTCFCRIVNHQWFVMRSLITLSQTCVFSAYLCTCLKTYLSSYHGNENSSIVFLCTSIGVVAYCVTISLSEPENSFYMHHCKYPSTVTMATKTL